MAKSLPLGIETFIPSVSWLIAYARLQARYVKSWRETRQRLA